ncbi:hypothetical protein PIROE2DRAFT_56985 [Piromyces sp. E2]|nr:hypothetical protein PIROE2DRAFT_56985 [Piromyces sp. E2]|eukprot:OUM70106.1 hypothetical protein PIROE2DRAFT_56985 [Piromyces sp. E2]
MPRIFHIVINPKSLEFYEDIKRYVMGLKYFQYLLVCEHIGQAEQHYHMLLQLNDNLPKLSVKKMHGAHIIPKTYGSTKKIVEYVKAEDEAAGVTAVLIDEEGKLLRQGGNQLTIGEVIDLTEDDVRELPAIQYNVVRNIRRDYTVTHARDFRKEVKVFWIQGPSGVGKTNKAMEIASEWEITLGTGTDFIKYINNFYLGTTKLARIAIYDDFRCSDMKPAEFINLIDYNKHWMNIKGDAILNNYNVIIITSIQKLERIYGNVPDEPRRQWERRIEVINMFPPERVHLGGLDQNFLTVQTCQKFFILLLILRALHFMKILRNRH